MTVRRGGAGHVDRGARGGAEVDRRWPRTKPVPVTVTVLPPAWGPLFGLTAGDRRRGVVGVTCQLALVAEVPSAVVTVTSTVPVPDGATTVRLVPVPFTLIGCPRLEPKSTAWPGQAGARDRDGGAPACGPVVRVDPVTVGGVVGVLVTGAWSPRCRWAWSP